MRYSLIALLLFACKTTKDESTEVDDGLRPVSDPGYPDFPDTIGTLSVTARTGNGPLDSADANEISVCLNANRCFPLDIPDLNSFRSGEADDYSFELVELPRSEVDRIELRSENGNDAWKPACLSVAFDGEMAYCNDGLDVWMGAQEGEFQSWEDPDGLHLSCGSCYPEPLSHGPMVGSVTDTTANIWVRTTATHSVSLQMSRGPELTHDAKTVAWLYPSADRDFTGELQVDGLTADQEYSYGITVDDKPYTDPTWRFRTAPETGSTTAARIAFGSCAKLATQPIFDVITEQNPDLFLFVGDNHYADSNDLQTVRWYYKWSRVVPQRAAFIAHTPILATWDDHDFTGNNTDGTDPGKAESLRAFSEYWANPSYGTTEVPGVFHQSRWGDIDLYFLDDRFYRGLDDRMLGEGQLDWLIERLNDSSASVKLLITGSQWTLEGTGDSWRSFPDERAILFEHLAANAIPGVVLLSGDVHRSEFRLIDPMTGGYKLPEITSSPLATVPSPCKAPTEELLACSATPSFVQLDIDTGDARQIKASIIDQSGVVLHEWLIRIDDLQ